MELSKIRTKIDETDQEIRELLLKRMGYSHQVAEAKVESGDTTIYRADREASILENLGDSVDEEIRTEYLSVVRKIMETSRMYQYGLIFDWMPNAFGKVSGHELATEGHAVTVRLTREDRPNAMSAILSMIGDYGYNMDRMAPVEDSKADENPYLVEIESTREVSDKEFCSQATDRKADPSKSNEPGTVTFDLTILGNLAETNMQKLMFQLNGECKAFQILKNE